jgi:hypothetical protein
MSKGLSKEGIMFATGRKRSALGPKQPKPRPLPPTGNQLFIIGHEAWTACSIDEVEATCAALREAGLYALPFDKVDLELLADDAINWVHIDGTSPVDPGLVPHVEKDGKTTFRSHLGPSVVLRLEGLSTVSDSDFKMRILDSRPKLKGYDVTNELVLQGKKEFQRQRHVDLLIALLATRNAVKDTRQNKLAKLGIGKKGKHAAYEYVTTISTPKVEEMPDDEEHPPTGRTVCPHLRRAHWKNVAYGPGRQFRRAKLIASVFVNADREWTKTRIAYNVSLPGPD